MQDDDPPPPLISDTQTVDEESVEQLTQMGFPRDQAILALVSADGARLLNLVVS